MTVREYLASITDEFDKLRVCAEIARKHPEYEKASRHDQRTILKHILDEEIPEEAENEDSNI